MDAKPILNDPESLSQDEIQTSHLNDGLRILARIIAKAYLRKNMADKNSTSEITLPSSQRNSVNDIGNGDGSQL